MTHHHQKNNKTGLYIVAGIAILLGAVYLVSTGNIFAKNRRISNTTSTASSYSCPMAKSQNGVGGCGMMGNRTTVQTQNLASQQTTPTALAARNLSYETVNLGHTAFALNPETVTLKAGKNYKLVITPTENGGGCMSTMTIPGLDSNVYPIKKGTPITINITNAQAGNYEVVCGAMGMHQGYINIQ